jgi:cell division protein FtsB
LLYVKKNVKIYTMRWKIPWRRPLVSLTQFVVMLVLIAALVIVVDFNRRERAGRLVGVGEDALRAELEQESTRSVELHATRAYVQSDDYVEIYAREEGGYKMPGEKRIVPLVIEATPAATPYSEPTPDPALDARPWQAWWQLLSDKSLPSR